MSLEEDLCIVPHLKAPISGQKLWGKQAEVSFWNAILKISILLYKMASGYEVLSLAVCNSEPDIGDIWVHYGLPK